MIVNKIGITLTDEIAFSTERINVNFSNYSSWHYRSTLDILTSLENVANELVLVQNAVFTDPVDTSAWFYLRWVLSNPAITKKQKDELLEALEQLQELEPDCKCTTLSVLCENLFFFKLCFVGIVMAKCWLAGNIILLDKEHVENHLQYYKDLIRLDPLRKGHYEDCLKIIKNKNVE